MSKQWKNALIIAIVILVVGSIGVYKYRNYCIIQAVEYALSAEMDPTKDIHFDDYKNIQEYSAVCQEVESIYEEMAFKRIAELYWSTPDRVIEIYIRYIENK